MRTALLGVAVALGSCAVQLCGEPVRATPTHPAQVAAQDVVQGMAEAGITIGPGQVSFPTAIPATVEHARLELLGLEPLGTTTRAKMRCLDRSACIPFYVAVMGIADVRMGRRDLPSDSEKNDAAKRAPERKPSAPLLMKRDSEAEPLLMKPGSEATLHIAANHMQITVPVICLQNGHKGERIRVASVDHTKTFVGEVVSAGYLRAELQE